MTTTTDMVRRVLADLREPPERPAMIVQAAAVQRLIAASTAPAPFLDALVRSVVADQSRELPPWGVIAMPWGPGPDDHSPSAWRDRFGSGGAFDFHTEFWPEDFHGGSRGDLARELSVAMTLGGGAVAELDGEWALLRIDTPPLPIATDDPEFDSFPKFPKGWERYVSHGQ